MTSYTNPVLDADWPDPDAVRFGDEFVMVASSFNRAPGLPVLVSPDLVQWRFATNALAAVPPAEHFSLPRHGGGVWAPAIREHGGRLVIVFPDPDHGIWTTWADRPEGPWSEPHLLLAGSGLIDPCPLWDDDGAAYLVHGWAASRAGVKNRLTVVPVDSALTAAIGPGRVVFDGDQVPGFSTLEGPKFYKRDGQYWIFAPAGGVSTGWQSVLRSGSVWGPYEHRTVLAQGDTDVNGPHQGAWVSDSDGADWFLHFQDRGVYGRVVHLQPMTWGAEGWPVIGVNAVDGVGQPVRTHARPASCSGGGGVPVPPSPVSDDFHAPQLQHAWHWQANPGVDWHETGAGELQLRHLPNDRGDVRDLPQVLGQLLPGWPVTVDIDLELNSETTGARLGVTVLGRAYSWIGLQATADGVQLVAAHGEGRQHEDGVLRVPHSRSVRVQLRSHGDGTVTLTAAGHSVAVAAREGHWIGAEIGLFAAAPEGTDGGVSRVRAFTVTHE